MFKMISFHWLQIQVWPKPKLSSMNKHACFNYTEKNNTLCTEQLEHAQLDDSVNQRGKR